MRVLIVDASSQDRDLAARYLQSAGHRIVVANDAKNGLLAVDREPPEVVVLDSLVAGMTPVQVIQRLRAKEQTTRAYVILASAKPCTSELTAAIAAGADDFMRKPLQRDELVMRVGALDRIRGWAAKVFGAANNTFLDLAAGAEISRLQAWQQIDRAITKDISELLGRSLVPASAEDAMASSIIGAHMPLTLASEQTEVRLTVGVDAPSLAMLGQLCLGDAAAPEDALRDVVREFANTAGGAFMRAAAQEGVSLTCGLPVDLGIGAFTANKPTAHQQFVVGPRDGSLRVTFEVEILAKALRRVNVSQLTEGMVLARDLHTESGALLVPGGTRLTSSQIERMSRIVSARITFDVAEAA
jgi:DNA-binding response OmpR family regulator